MRATEKHGSRLEHLEVMMRWCLPAGWIACVALCGCSNDLTRHLLSDSNADLSNNASCSTPRAASGLGYDGATIPTKAPRVLNNGSNAASGARDSDPNALLDDPHAQALADHCAVFWPLPFYEGNGLAVCDDSSIDVARHLTRIGSARTGNNVNVIVYPSPHFTGKARALGPGSMVPVWAAASTTSLGSIRTWPHASKRYCTRLFRERYFGGDMIERCLDPTEAWTLDVDSWANPSLGASSWNRDVSSLWLGDFVGIDVYTLPNFNDTAGQRARFGLDTEQGATFNPDLGEVDNAIESFRLRSWIEREYQKASPKNATRLRVLRIAQQFGKLDICVRYKAPGLFYEADRDNLVSNLKKVYQDWHASLVGYPGWRGFGLDVRIAGYAAAQRSILDWSDNNVPTFINTDVNCSVPYDLFVSVEPVGYGKGWVDGIWVDPAFVDNDVIIGHEAGHSFGIADMYDVPDDDRPFSIMAIRAPGVTAWDRLLLQRIWDDNREDGSGQSQY